MGRNILAEHAICLVRFLDLQIFYPRPDAGEFSHIAQIAETDKTRLEREEESLTALLWDTWVQFYPLGKSS